MNPKDQANAQAAEVQKKLDAYFPQMPPIYPVPENSFDQSFVAGLSKSLLGKKREPYAPLDLINEERNNLDDSFKLLDEKNFIEYNEKKNLLFSEKIYLQKQKYNLKYSKHDIKYEEANIENYNKKIQNAKARIEELEAEEKLLWDNDDDDDDDDDAEETKIIIKKIKDIKEKKKEYLYDIYCYSNKIDEAKIKIKEKSVSIKESLKELEKKEEEIREKRNALDQERAKFIEKINKKDFKDPFDDPKIYLDKFNI